MMLEAKQFNSIKGLEGISQKTMAEHYKLYEGYVKKANEILNLLEKADRSSANQTFSDWRQMKVELSFALGGVKNHETYFEHLGGSGGQPKGKLLELIERDFGSFKLWQEDLKATGMASRGWAWLAYDFDLKKLVNFAGDAQNTYPVWNAAMLVALDVYEHAYYLDYQTDRSAYIEAFMRNLNWSAVEESFAKLPIS